MFKSGPRMSRHLLSPKEVDKQYNINVNLLQRWRQSGFGPPYLKIGDMIRYQRKALEKWLNQWELIPRAKTLSYDFSVLGTNIPDHSGTNPIDLLPIGRIGISSMSSVVKKF